VEIPSRQPNGGLRTCFTAGAFESNDSSGLLPTATAHKSVRPVSRLSFLGLAQEC